MLRPGKPASGTQDLKHVGGDAMHLCAICMITALHAIVLVPRTYSRPFFYSN